MARRVQESGRTGWLYRVLEPGYVQAGDAIVVVERPLPEWSILRLQHYLYSEIDNIDMAAYLADLPFLSVAQKKLLRKRVENAGVIEDWGSRLSNGAIGGSGLQWVEARIDRIHDETKVIKSFRFERVDGRPWPPLFAGGHVKIKVGNALTRSYSLTTTRRQAGVNIAVQLAANSEGGSSHLHKVAAVGDHLMVSVPQDSFPLADSDSRHVMLASGIGITPFLSMIERLEDLDRRWELHYCARTADDAAFREELTSAYPDRVHMHLTDGDSRKRLDVISLLADESGKHVYSCGSVSFLEAVRDATAHWPTDTVHFESFTSTAVREGDQSFSARIRSSGKVVEVPAGTPLLHALREAALTVDSSCETGTCGTCKLRYLSGCVDHRDMVLSRAERSGSIITCVSRATGELVIDL
jgi:ferredoxin-NADP reductase